MKKKEVPIIFDSHSKVSIETVNRGNPCYYRDKQYYLVYEASSFTLIARNKDLTGVFSVKRTEVDYVKTKKG